MVMMRQPGRDPALCSRDGVDQLTLPSEMEVQKPRLPEATVGWGAGLIFPAGGDGTAVSPQVAGEMWLWLSEPGRSLWADAEEEWALCPGDGGATVWYPEASTGTLPQPWCLIHVTHLVCSLSVFPGQGAGVEVKAPTTRV